MRRLAGYEKLAQLMRGDTAEDLMWRERPVCRRCGRKVQQVESRWEVCADVLVVHFGCHGAWAPLRISHADVEYPPAVWPTHVFEYEATSFGSWDANGAPV